MKFYFTRKNLVVLVLAPCALIFCMFLSGCGEKKARQAGAAVVKGAAVHLGKPAIEPVDEKRAPEQVAVDAASDKVATLTGDLAKAKAELEQKEDALKKARYASLRKLAFWVAGIAFLATCAATAAAFFLPAFRTQFLMGAASCVAVLVVSLCLESLLDYVPWIGGAIAVGIVGWLILALRKSRKAIAATAEAGDLFADAYSFSEVQKIKAAVKASQIKAGVHQLIQDARGKLSPKQASGAITALVKKPHDAPR